MVSRTIRLAAALAIGVALAVAAAISSDNIRVVDRLLTLSWVPAVILALLLIGVAAAIGFTLPQPALVPERPLSRSQSFQARQSRSVVASPRSSRSMVSNHRPAARRSPSTWRWRLLRWGSSMVADRDRSASFALAH